MKYFYILIVQLTVCLAYRNREIRYRKDGQYMIGAILPLTKEDKNGNCSRINPEGITIAEAIVHASERISSEGEFKDLIAKKSIGYDIRDNCGKASETKYHVFNMTREAMMFRRGQTKTIPVQIIISEFPTESIKSLPVLNSEDIIQISYSKNNARLKKDSSISKYAIKQLISMYPESTKKIMAVVDIIKSFQFNYVYAVASDNIEGSKALGLLSQELGKYKICKSEDLYASNVVDINKALDKIAENPKIRVVVVYCTKDVELSLYNEAGKRNMTDLIFISTQNWDSDIDALKPYAPVVEGMVFIHYEKNIKYIQNYMRSMKVPYRTKKWLKLLFVDVGGNATCLANRLLNDYNCADNELKVTNLLQKYSPVAVYAFEAMYAIAYALKKSVEDRIPLLEATKDLRVEIPTMAFSKIKFNKELAIETSQFRIFSVRGNSAQTFDNKWLGQWDEDKVMLGPLIIRKQEVKWKNGEKEIPLSVCSASCPPGYERSFLNENVKCCWECAKCPNGTASNISNSDKCMTCSEGFVVQPDQAGCIAYKLLYFNWFGGVGSLIIVLMVVGVALILFSLGIFSQNSNHELVINANYTSLCFFLLACLILIFSPIPLLMQPTISSCLTYIILFNVSISMVLGILVSRSAYVNGLFDENGHLAKGTLGSYPRVVIVAVIVVLQFIVIIVANKMEQLQIIHNHTEQWNERYHECSSWASLTFWAAFVYNVLVSVVGNSMSCTSTKVQDNAFELKYILLSHLLFYLVDLIELCVFFRSSDEHLAGGQAINCIIYAFVFYICYIVPKIHVILFRSKGNKAIEKPLNNEEEQGMMTTAIHASAGFKNQGIVQMKIRDEN